MKLLIIGSEGFIGGHLVHFYKAKGDTVFGADLLEQGRPGYSYFKLSRLSPELDELLQKDAFDICINAAGSGNVPYSMTHPLIDFEANTLDVIRILDAIRRLQPACRYLHISSAAVYGNPEKLPIHEDDKLLPISPYGWHKLMAENVCKEFTAIYGLYTAIVRPFSVFGPGLKKQLIWDMYQKITNAAQDAELELWGTGKESRDFIYVEALTEALDSVIRNSAFQSDKYNIASGIETTIEELATFFVQAIGKPVHIRFNGHTRVGDPQNWRADVSRLAATGFTPSINWQEGIKKTVAWLKG